jgi:hypothetical protein
MERQRLKGLLQGPLEEAFRSTLFPIGKRGTERQSTANEVKERSAHMSKERTTDDVPPHKPRATRFEDFAPRTDDEDDPRINGPVPEAPMWIGSAWPDWPIPGRR